MFKKSTGYEAYTVEELEKLLKKASTETEKAGIKKELSRRDKKNTPLSKDCVMGLFGDINRHS